MTSLFLPCRPRLVCARISSTIRHQSSSSGSSSSATIYPSAPLFNRREKRKLRIAYPRPEKAPQLLYPALPAMFVNRVTMADGSTFYLSTGSPRTSIALVRDVTNHPLWNPSLAREVAGEDQSGRMGRFARRYAGPKIDQASPSPTLAGAQEEPSARSEASELERQRALNKSSFEQQGFGAEDLDWISGESAQSFYGPGTAKNIKGMKKPSPTKK